MSDFSISSIGYYPGMGFNSGFADMDTDIGQYQLFGPNNGSIFSQLPGMNTYCNDFANQYNPTNPWANQTNYFEYMNKYRDFWHQYNLQNQKMNRSSDAEINAPMRAIKTTAQNLKDKIKANEQDQIMPAYNAYLAAVKRAYPDISDEDLKAQALSTYETLNQGKSIIKDLKEYSSGSFLDGFHKAISFGLYNSISAEDNISKITGLDQGKGESAKNVLGHIAGAGVIGGIGYCTTKLWPSKLPKISSSNKLAIVVAGITAGLSLISSAIFKPSS